MTLERTISRDRNSPQGRRWPPSHRPGRRNRRGKAAGHTNQSGSGKRRGTESATRKQADSNLQMGRGWRSWHSDSSARRSSCCKLPCRDKTRKTLAGTAWACTLRWYRSKTPLGRGSGLRSPGWGSSRAERTRSCSAIRRGTCSRTDKVEGHTTREGRRIRSGTRLQLTTRCRSTNRLCMVLEPRVPQDR